MRRDLHDLAYGVRGLASVLALCCVGLGAGCTVDGLDGAEPSSPRTHHSPDADRQKPHREQHPRVDRPRKKHTAGPYDDGVLVPEVEESGVWSCRWSPTMNRDWHDDMLCANGLGDEKRPYLLTDDSFVERYEIEQAAAVWAASMND
ncbi:hypothetical protein [Nocardioides sp. MH1]|uniref:hypothetical protein n=1 Tax=Nocardioides sp. MH1 TaxID=3242490 RepID=UPI00351FCEA4